MVSSFPFFAFCDGSLGESCIEVSPEKRPPAKPTELQRFGAELTGTFFLTLVAAGGDILDQRTGAVGHTARYLAPGLLVTAMIWSLSGISGAHINPAVTFAFVLRRRFPFMRAVGYWVAQFAGAILAALALRGFFASDVAFGITHAGADVTPLGAMLWEALLTALLLLVILGTAEQEAVVGKNVALAVGLTVALCGLFSSPMTGASMNPARSLGPGLVGGDMSQTWIYVIGPLLGAAVSTGLVRLLHGPLEESAR